MSNKKLPEGENIYETDCPILYAMELFGQKWKLPIIWYIGDNGHIRYNELQRKVVGITSTMLSKCLRELERDHLVTRKQYMTIPPAVEYSLTDSGKSLVFALDSIYNWSKERMKNRTQSS